MPDFAVKVSLLYGNAPTFIIMDGEKDIWGNTPKDIQGNPTDKDAQGNRPKDVQGNVSKDIYGNETIEKPPV